MTKKRRRLSNSTSLSPSTSSSFASAMQQQSPPTSSTTAQQHERSTETESGDKGKRVPSPTDDIQIKSEGSYDFHVNLTDDANQSKQHLHQLIDRNCATCHVQPDGTFVVTIRPHPPLPNDMIASILAHVAADAQSTLYQCALVNSQFYTLAIPLLWKAPKFNNNTGLLLFLRNLLFPTATATIAAAAAFGSLPSSSQHILTLGHHIHELQLEGQYWTDHLLLLLTPYLTHLKRLCIHANTSITDASFQYIPRYCQHLLSLHLISALSVDSFFTIGQYCYQLAEFTYSGQQPLCPERLDHLTICPLKRLTICGEQQQQQEQYAVNEALAPIIQQFNLLTHLKLKNMAPGLARSLLLVLPSPSPPLTTPTLLSHQNYSYPCYDSRPTSTTTTTTTTSYTPHLTSSLFFLPPHDPMPPRNTTIARGNNNSNSMVDPNVGSCFYVNNGSSPAAMLTIPTIVNPSQGPCLYDPITPITPISPIATTTNTSAVFWPHLTHLALDHCHHIDDTLLIGFLESHPHLASIHLEGTSPLTNAVLLCMEHRLLLPGLTDLYFSKNDKITAGGIRDLILYGLTSSLTKIHLDGCHRIMACDFFEVWKPNDKRHRFWLDRHAMDKIRQWHHQQQQHKDGDDDDDGDDDNE